MPKKKVFDPAKLPSTVYVKWEPDDEAPFLIASEDIESEETTGTYVGIYALVEVRQVRILKTLEVV